MITLIRFLLIDCIVLALLCSSTSAQTPKGTPKRPIGVPTDAELFNGKWYRLYNESLHWSTARQKCVTLGGQLVVVPDEPTWVFLRERIQKAMVWLGATDEASPGIWKWHDGTPFTFKAWHQGQPNNLEGKEHYLSTWEGAWNDVRGDGKFTPNSPLHVTGFICEWKDK